MELEADDAPRWAAIDALFAGCAESAGSPQLRLQFTGNPPELPGRAPDLAYTGIDVWLGGDGAACRSSAGVAARRRDDVIEVGGPTDSVPTPDQGLDSAVDLATAFRRSVQHVLADALAEHDRHTLHAASISDGERVLVAVGGTGAGKSTLAYAASRREWTVLSDDLTFLTMDGNQLVAWGLPKPLNIPGDLIGADDDGAAGDGRVAIVDDARNRVRVPLPHSPAVDAGRVSGVLIIEHAVGPAHVERIEPGPQLLKTLLPSFPLAPDRRRMRELFPIAAALSRLPAWTLHHDADPARRLDAAATLLQQIVEGLDPDDADQ